MKKILLTGATGFIGSYIFQRLHHEYDLIKVDRDFFDSARSNNSQIDSDIDCVVHCAYSQKSLKANLDMVQTLYEKLCKSDSNDKRLIILGTFAGYENHASFITESTKPIDARFKYLLFKNEISKKVVELASGACDIKIIELQPTIVMGDGGGWQRLANRIAKIKGNVRVPFGGSGYCNVIEVEDVVFYIKSIIDLNSVKFNDSKYYKFLITGGLNIKWRDWLIRYANIPESKIIVSNENEWHYNCIINFFMKIYLRRGGRDIFKFNSFELLSDSSYEPRGMDRYAMSSQGAVDDSKIKNFLKI